ncbi:MAG TPA: ATP-dependent RNA helicase HrpA, partial [Phycisphaerales bacterium]|nr:ATP-dependent RNA helicase HrpA [Phycisphaerales bacterium]
EREIRETAEALRKHHPPGATEILPLYARLSADEQQRVFKPRAAKSARRIVLATNVAETSLTVPGIMAVIDTGLARISRYSTKGRVQRLPVEPIAQSSADQRKGRAGRIAPGLCIRLYSESDFTDRPRFTEPEILRTNLASVILQMTSLNLGEVDRFPFIDPPDSRLIRDGYDTLAELGAVDDNRKITPVGRRLARLPIDPRLGRMILAAREENCLTEVLIIAAALAAQDPRERPMDPPGAAESADKAHAPFQHEHSDFLFFVNLYNWHAEQVKHLSHNKLRKLCRDMFLSHHRVREWLDVHQQLRAIMKEVGGDAFTPNAQPADYDRIHRALLAGLITSVGTLSSAVEYTGIDGLKFHVFPGSILFKTKPKWLMAAELVKTSRLFARTCARIEPGWIETVAPHLVRRSYSEPQWIASSGGGQVFAHETVTLRGLTIVPHRRVKLGHIDPALSRQIFISRALVEGDFHTVAPFVAHNKSVLEGAAKLEAKARKRDLVVGPDLIHAFYDRIVPPDVYNGPAFEKWRSRAEHTKPDLLQMKPVDVLVPGALESDATSADLYPDVLRTPSGDFALDYNLAPGEPIDGVTAIIPAHILSHVQPDIFEWLVPGFLKEKLVALIRSLPKDIRRAFGSAPDAAEEVLIRWRSMPAVRRGSLLDALASEAGRAAGVRVDRSAFRLETLPPHLFMNFRVVDEDNNEIPGGTGRDLAAVKAALAASRPLSDFLHATPGDVPFTERDGLNDWTFGDVPDHLSITKGGFKLDAYPAIIDESHSVALRLMRSQSAAQSATRAGIRRLFFLQLKGEITSLVATLPEIERARAQHAAMVNSLQARSGGAKGAPSFNDELALLVADLAFLADPPHSEPIRTAAQFQQRLDSGWNRLGEAASSAGALMTKVLAAYHAAALRLESLEATTKPAPQAPAQRSAAMSLKSPASPAQDSRLKTQDSLRDLRAQLSHLLAPGFATNTPYRWLQQYPRFLRAAELRLEKLSLRGQTGIDQDHALMEQVRTWQHEYDTRAHSTTPPAAASETRPSGGVAPTQTSSSNLGPSVSSVATSSPELDHFRWLIEELRVSLFAQQLRTSVPVSEKRLREALTAADAASS